MNFFEMFLFFLQAEMKTPIAFGLFHLTCVAITFITIVILCKNKEFNEYKLKWIIGVYGIIAFLLELLKQLIWSFNFDTVTKMITWDYEWYAFPFQLCTTPIFVCLICLFLKKCKFRDYLFSYMSYITILGSITTVVMPDSCFVSDILVNIHTMWLHLGSLVVSIYLLISKEVKINFQYLKKAILVFIIFVIIALLLNILVYNLDILKGETFNMFYISPYFISSLPIFNIIQENVPYILFLIIYIIALSIGGYIIYLLARTIYNCVKKKKIL